MIEVKLAITGARAGGWAASPAFAQARRYADRLGVGSTLIDAQRILLIDREADAPHTVIERARASDADLVAIRRHLLGCGSPAKTGFGNRADTCRTAGADTVVTCGPDSAHGGSSGAGAAAAAGGCAVELEEIGDGRHGRERPGGA